MVQNNNYYTVKFITIAEMADAIRRNFAKVPHDVDFVIGIPRSGILCASIISEFLNVPLIDVDSFCSGAKPTGGSRLRQRSKKQKTEGKKKVLVVDDTVYGGFSNRKARKQLEPFTDKYEFIYLVVYLEGKAADAVDLYLEDVREYTTEEPFIVIYEWNIFHHIKSLMSKCIYDIDGVLCVNSPDERNEEEYIEYIKNAIPLFTPTVKIGELLSYRLIKNEEITKKWLSEHGITYGKMTLFDAQTWDDRKKSGITPDVMKGEYYKEQKWAILFVESDDQQARRIFEISGKPVYCVESNKFYSN
jgi:hypoxanthine phosphoribosyltransferase